MYDFAQVMELEKRMEFSSLKAGSTWIYPLLKQRFLYHTINNKNNISQSPSNFQLIKKPFDSLKWRLKNTSLKKYDIIFFDNAFSTRIDQEGNYYSTFTSHLLKGFSLNHKCLLYEFPLETYPWHISYQRNTEVYYADWDLLKSVWKERNINLNRLNIPFKDIELLFESLKLSISETKINKTLRRFFYLTSYYIKLLKETNPKVIFLVSSYSLPKMALIKAAKNLDIPSIELQHGHVFPEHIGYIYKTVLSRDLFPDYFWSFGKYFSEILINNSLMFDPHKIKEIGFFNFELQKTSSVKNEFPFLKRLIEKKVILFSSQKTVRKEFKEFILGLSEELPEDHIILYKPHPSETDALDFYQSFTECKNIILINDSNISSIDLMKLSHFHTTVYSTTAFEANAMGLPNIFLKIGDYDAAILDLLDKNVNFIVKTKEEYLKILLLLGKSNWTEISKKCKLKSYHYYNPDVTENIRRVISEINTQLKFN